MSYIEAKRTYDVWYLESRPFVRVTDASGYAWFVEIHRRGGVGWPL